MYKSDKQRKFLFEMDKNQGVNPMASKTSPMAIKTQSPGQMNVAPQSFKVGTIGTPPAFKAPSITPQIKPISSPTLPTMPRFAKLKKALNKKEF